MSLYRDPFRVLLSDLSDEWGRDYQQAAFTSGVPKAKREQFKSGFDFLDYLTTQGIISPTNVAPIKSLVPRGLWHLIDAYQQKLNPQVSAPQMPSSNMDQYNITGGTIGAVGPGARHSTNGFVSEEEFRDALAGRGRHFLENLCAELPLNPIARDGISGQALMPAINTLYHTLISMCNSPRRSEIMMVLARNAVPIWTSPPRQAARTVTDFPSNSPVASLCRYAHMLAPNFYHDLFHQQSYENARRAAFTQMSQFGDTREKITATLPAFKQLRQSQNNSTFLEQLQYMIQAKTLPKRRLNDSLDVPDLERLYQFFTFVDQKLAATIQEDIKRVKLEIIRQRERERQQKRETELLEKKYSELRETELADDEF